MADIRFNLTVDSLFNFCEVLEAIGFDSVAEEFGKEDLEAFQKKDVGSVGMTVITKVSKFLIKKLPGVRNEIYKFLTGCAEWEDGTPVSVEDVRKMKITHFVKMIREFLKTEGVMDFFGEAAGLLDTEQPDSKSSATNDTVIPMDI